MNKLSVVILALLLSFPAIAADGIATPKQTEVIVVTKVAAAVAANRAETLKEITAKDQKWIDRDLYTVVVVYDMNGKCLAHGVKEGQVGKDLIDLADADGKKIVKERIELAKSKGKFWQDYKFTDPVTRKVLPKSVYCEKSGDMIICAGIYPELFAKAGESRLNRREMMEIWTWKLS